MSTDQEAEPADGAATRRKFLMLEVLALCSLHLTSVFYPLLGFSESGVTEMFTASHLRVCVSDLAFLGLYLFVMYSSGDPLSAFGIRRIRWKSDLIALSVAALGVASIYLIYHQIYPSSIQGIERARHSPLASFFISQVSPLWLIGVSCLCVGAYEEVAFRGYLIPRLEELFGSTWVAVITQALFFGLAHTYQGSSGMLLAMAFGLVFGVVFAKWRTVLPLALVHAVYDFAVFYRVLHLLTAKP